MKEKLISLAADRSRHLQAAEDALRRDDRETYDKEMQAVEDLNGQMAPIQALLHEQEQNALEGVGAGTPADNTAVENQVNALRRGQRITMEDAVVRRALNSTLIGSDTLAKPTGVGTTIHDNNTVVSAVIDHVTVMDLNGCAQWDEPYVKTDPTAAVGTDGTAPTASDPVFRVASVKPVLVETLSYVSRHIENLTPVNYLAKVQELALKALRRKVVELVALGDGSNFYGLTNAANTKGEAITKTLTVSTATIGADFLRKVVLGSGGSETTGAGFLLLNKADLIALGDVRGTNEKKAVFDITSDPATFGNTGTIRDGGLVVNYILVDKLTALSTATKGATAIKTMVYVDLSAYVLGLFGNYTVEVSKDYKFAEGLLAVRGEVMAGGNLCADQAATVVTLAGTGSGS